MSGPKPAISKLSFVASVHDREAQLRGCLERHVDRDVADIIRQLDAAAAFRELLRRCV